MHQTHQMFIFILGFDPTTIQEWCQQSGCTLSLLIYWLMSGRMRVGPCLESARRRQHSRFCCVHTWLLSRDLNPPFYKLPIHKNEVMRFPILFYYSALVSYCPTCFCSSKQKQVGDYYHNYVKSDEIILLARANNWMQGMGELSGKEGESILLFSRATGNSIGPVIEAFFISFLISLLYNSSSTLLTLL